ncbi:MAG: helix-turn-helix domain-containing protein [Caulobacteraceae bacterium]
MPELKRFTTADALPGQGFELWRRRMEVALGECKATALGAGDFHAEVETIVVGDVSLARIAADPHRLERVRQGALDGAGKIHVLFVQKGRFRLEQNGRCALLEAGDWCFYDTSRTFVCANDEPTEVLAMMAPRAAVFGRDISAYQCAAERFSSAKGAARVARSYLASLFDELPDLNPSISSDLASTAVQLVRLVAAEALRQRSVLSIKDMLRARIESYVCRNLRNPELTVDMVAAAHACTKRYVHKIFSAEETLGQYILNARLDRCRDDLLKPELSNLSITEIAFSWGFNSSAHFSRVFRRRFGVSPSACRAPAPVAVPWKFGTPFTVRAVVTA